LQSFQELNISSPLLQAIQTLGFVKPSPIQSQALPILLGAPTDFLGLAATGTGKTAAFAIPLIERLDPAIRAVQAIVLCPTRELALQVSKQFDLLGQFKGVSALPIYGGASYGDQLKGLKRGPSVVVGTPGRIVDHLERGSLKLDQVELVVLDEADEMISMGFKEDLEFILSNIPPGMCNTWLFSATMSPGVRRVADEYLHAPKQVQVNRTEILPSTLEQFYYCTQESNKAEVLCKIIEAADDFYGIVFCQTKSLVVDLTQYLRGRNYAVDCLHGDLDQSARERVMQSFRNKKVRLLVCTDVASRGLDVQGITHVLNYSIPQEMDSYVHRIGRTARSGQSGFAMNLVTPSQRGLIHRIEKFTQRKMKEGKIPTRKEVGMRKVGNLLESFRSQAGFGRAVDLLDPSWRQELQGKTTDEVAGRFLCLLFPEIFSAERVAAAAEEEKAQRPPQILGRRSEADSGGRFRGSQPPRRGNERDRRGHSGHQGRPGYFGKGRGGGSSRSGSKGGPVITPR
jgi:ATP-dependent RNA helicase DeaD